MLERLGALSREGYSDPQAELHSEEQDRAILARGRAVLVAEADALARLEEQLDAHFVTACRTIVDSRRQLVVTGMGKSGHIARKIAATFSATGTPAVYVHPGEAGHGDLGMLAAGDVLLVLSNSGNTTELRDILTFARHAGIPIIGVASRRDSMVMDLADVPLLMPTVREACSINLAPTSSTTMQLALGDALAMAVMDLRCVSQDQLRALHPAGAIGLSLRPVRELMHAGERLPLVPADATMAEAVSVMTSRCLGLTGVTDASGVLVGVITDGDLRRHFDVIGTAHAKQVMSTSPKLMAAALPIVDALQFLNEHKITAAFVVEDPAAGPALPLGVIHIHDLLRHGLA